MKVTPCLFSITLLVLTSCSTATPDKNFKSSPETVLVTYHVKVGKEMEFQTVLARAWGIYRQEHLVFADPHVIVQEKENGDKIRFIEIFTWISHETPEHAPDSVTKIWNEMQSLCESRDGHSGIDGGEVELIAPK